MIDSTEMDTRLKEGKKAHSRILKNQIPDSDYSEKPLNLSDLFLANPYEISEEDREDILSLIERNHTITDIKINEGRIKDGEFTPNEEYNEKTLGEKNQQVLERLKKTTKDHERSQVVKLNNLINPTATALVCA